MATEHDTIMNWAICALALFGFICSGERSREGPTHIYLPGWNSTHHHRFWPGVTASCRQRCSWQLTEPLTAQNTFQVLQDRPATKRGWYLHWEDWGRYLPSCCCTVRPSLPFEVKSQAYFWSATKSLHVQRVASYQNCGQHSKQLGPLAQTLWDIAFSLQPRPPQGSVCINDLTTKAWGDGTGLPFWLT